MIDNELIKYLIKKFEDKIHSNPLSTEFVRLANYYIIDDRLNEAISILKHGLNFYPHYLTAKLLLGKAYLANRYYYDALKLFESVLSEYPALGIAIKYHDIARELSRNEVSRRIEDDIIPKLEFKAPAFNEHDYNYNLFPNYEIEDLNNDIYKKYNFEDSDEFSDFKKVFESSLVFKREGTVPKYEKKRLKNKYEVKIITETLADIFAKQGNYFDAIEAYTHLLKTKPEAREQLERKINEIEMKIQEMINEV
jgi:tetratricopeptide (TPR) repeat protein